MIRKYKILISICHLVIFLITGVFVGCSQNVQYNQAERYLVGAHYYLWYPQNFKQGFLRQKLDPKQAPRLGLYSSNDIKVIEQHIRWSSQYGIDFLTLDYWPNRGYQNNIISDNFLKAKNIDDIKFCIFYETWAIGFNKDLGTTVFDSNNISRFINDLDHISKTFFDHPSYLHVMNRPVIILYLSRTFSGDYRSAIEMVRKSMKKNGYDPFIIGDEIFWKVTPLVEKESIPHPLTETPQVDRIKCFDAITSYNMYENGKKEHKGYGESSKFIEDVAAKYEEYIKAAGKGVVFVPMIIPGYNDRGVRLGDDHYAIPRQWNSEALEGSFLKESFERLAFRFLDPRINMILITSFNEWNEDTAIEPLTYSNPTNLDISNSRVSYTQGYSYKGYGETYLEVIRDKVIAISGRVTDKNGAPLKGINVIAKQNSVIQTGSTDTNGYYRISRLNLKEGKLSIKVRKAVKQLTIQKHNAVTGIDFTLSE